MSVVSGPVYTYILHNTWNITRNIMILYHEVSMYFPEGRGWEGKGGEGRGGLM